MMVLSLYQRYDFKSIGMFNYGLVWSLFLGFVSVFQSHGPQWSGQDIALAGGPYKWTFVVTAYTWPIYDGVLLLSFIIYILFHLEMIPAGSSRIVVLVMCFFMACDITSCLLLAITGLYLKDSHDQSRLGYYYLLFAILESNLSLITATVVGLEPSNPFRSTPEPDPTIAVTSPTNEPGNRPPDRVRSVTRFWYAIKAHRSKPKTINPSDGVITAVPVEEDRTVRFCCNKCTQSYGLEIHLNRHLGRHNGNPPYGCSHCTTGSLCEHRPRRWWWFGSSESTSCSKDKDSEQTSGGLNQLDGTNERRREFPLLGRGMPLCAYPLNDMEPIERPQFGGPSSFWPLGGNSRPETPTAENGSRPAGSATIGNGAPRD
jgi:hypothetical protein